MCVCLSRTKHVCNGVAETETIHSITLHCTMLMKVLSHPGHGNSKCYTAGNWTSVCDDVSPSRFFSSNYPEESCRLLNPGCFILPC